MVAPSMLALALATYLSTILSALFLEQEQSNEAASIDVALIRAAKQAQFPVPKKWARNRPLRSGERQRAIEFLQKIACL